MKYTEGQEVAHIDNLTVKMYVYAINRRKYLVSTGQKDKDGKDITIEKSRMEGISVHWFAPNPDITKEEKIFKEHKFHSYELVPWDIAQKGNDEAKEWLETQIFLNSKGN